MPKFHVVTLDEAQRLLLEKTVRSGTASALTVTRARILLKSDTGEFGPGWIDTEIADALDVSQSTVERTRKRAVLEGIEAAIVDLVDVHYPEAVRIILVLDNLDIHSPTSLYQAFPAAEARRLTEKLEIHYTPKRGSWLNMAEIELSILSRQCLDRRIPSTGALTEQVAAWEAARNREATGVNWRFTTADARIKLRHLYPSH